MESLDFRRILFKTAFCVMACDGHIDDLEVDEMKEIDQKTTYFKDVDLSDELDELVNQVQSEGKKIVKSLLVTLRETKLTIVQELLVLEVALRMINADNKVEVNEIRFLNLLRSKLEVDNEIIRERFGNIPYLTHLNYDNLEMENMAYEEYTNSIELPNISIISDINFKTKQ
jgi:hypothetical protein